jgi:hypothetical protein
LDKLNEESWLNLSCNPNAIHIVEQHFIAEKNLDKTYYWCNLSENPNGLHLLFSLDKNKMLENMKEFCEELVQTVFNPTRAQRMADLFNLDMVEYLELL